MQFALALDTNSGPHQIRSCEGDGIDRLEKLSIGGRKQEKALRNRCFGGRVAATTQCILTSDACPETLVSIHLNYYSYMLVYFTFVFSREIYCIFCVLWEFYTSVGLVIVKICSNRVIL